MCLCLFWIVRRWGNILVWVVVVDIVVKVMKMFYINFECKWWESFSDKRDFKILFIFMVVRKLVLGKSYNF